jgi:uncharacterized protein
MRLTLIALLLALCSPVIAQTPAENPDIPKNMKPYFLVFLVQGDKREQPPEEANKIQNEHLAYIRKNHEAGKYIFAGPFTEDERIRGIIVVKAKDAAEVRSIVGGDPAVKAGRLAVEVHPAIFADLSCLNPASK